MSWMRLLVVPQGSAFSSENKCLPYLYSARGRDEVVRAKGYIDCPKCVGFDPDCDACRGAGSIPGGFGSFDDFERVVPGMTV